MRKLLSVVAAWVSIAPAIIVSAQQELSEDFTPKAQFIVDCDQALRDAWKSGRCTVTFRTPSQLDEATDSFGEFKVEWRGLACRFDGKILNEGEPPEAADRIIFCSSGEQTTIWKPNRSVLTVISDPPTHPANQFFTIGWPVRGWAQLGPSFNGSVTAGLLKPPPTVQRGTVEQTGTHLTFITHAGEYGEGRRVFDLDSGGALTECKFSDRYQKVSWTPSGETFVPTIILFERGSDIPSSEDDYDTVIKVSNVDLKYTPAASRFVISEAEVPDGTLISTMVSRQSSVRTKGGTSVERTFERLRNAADAASESGFAAPESSK